MTDRDVELLRLRSLEARGLVEVLDPFGTDRRCVLTGQGSAYLRHHQHVDAGSSPRP